MPVCWRARAVFAAVLGSAVLGAACSAAKTAAPARTSAAQAASKGGLPTGLKRRALAAKYLVIAKAGNRRLEVDFDRLEGHDRNRLTSAEADLRDAAATERLFDRRLLRIAFPPEAERIARALYSVNQARARLTTAAAGSASLRQLRLYEPAVTAANGPVEQTVKTIRRQLGLPPPRTS